MADKTMDVSVCVCVPALTNIINPLATVFWTA